MHHASWITGATFFEIAVYRLRSSSLEAKYCDNDFVDEADKALSSSDVLIGFKKKFFSDFVNILGLSLFLFYFYLPHHTYNLKNKKNIYIYIYRERE